MAYLGKISAVLAANTQDFTRGLREAGQELQRFQKQAGGLRLNLDSNALDKTLTSLQRFEKTIQEIKKQIAANPEQRGLFPDPNRLQQQFKAFENIGKPLTELKNKIEGLSQTMQAGLYPELGKIQAGFQNLYRGIQSGSTTYDKETARIEGLIGALNRLAKTAAAAADFSDLTKKLSASNTGASFYQPRAKESLQDSLALRSRAEAVPARFRGGVFADLASAAEENAQKIEAQAAKILQIQNRIGSAGPVTPRNLLQARGQAQDNLDRLTSRQEFFNSAYRKELRSAEIQQVVSPGSERVVDSLTQKFASLSATLRGISGTQFEPLIGSVGRVVEQLIRSATSADRAKAAIEKLAAASRGTRLVGGMEEQAIASLRTKQSLDREAIRRQGQIERSADPFENVAGPLTRKQQKKRDRYFASSQVREDAGLAREEFNRTLLPRFTELRASAEGTGDASAIKKAQDMIRLANQMDAALRKAFRSEDPKAAKAALSDFQAQLAGMLPAIDRAEKKIRTLAEAQKQYGMFVSASGGRGGKLDPVLEGAASDIMTARQFRGQYSEGNLKGRVAVSQEILRVEGEILRLTKVRQLIEDAPGLSNNKRAKAYERNRKEIEAETQALLKLTAAQSGGVFREDRVLAAAQRARKNTGSFGMAGAASAQLALQQGLFAVDDFISSTGGIEYKLRAIGNNITQLGLLLGQSGLIPGLSATTGLFIGLAAVMGGQALSAMMRWASGTENAELSIKSMNDSLARQKSIVESLAQAFRSLGDSSLRGAYSDGGEKNAGFKNQIDDIRQKQVDLRRERAATFDETVQKERGEQNKLQKQMDDASDPGQRVSLAAAIEASRERERRAADSALERASSGATPRDVLGAVAGTIRSSEFLEGGRSTRRSREMAEARQAQAQADVEAAGGDVVKLQEVLRNRLAERQAVAIKPLGVTNFEENPEIMRAREDVGSLEKTLATLQDPVRAAIDRAANGIAEASRGPAVTIRQAQEDVADAIRRGVPNAAAFQRELDANATKLKDAYSGLENAQKETDTTKKQAKVDEARRNVADVEAEQANIRNRSREMRLGRTFGGQRATAALSSLQGDERFRNESAGQTAKLAAAIDAEVEAQNNLQSAREKGEAAAIKAAEAELDLAQKASEAAAALAEAAAGIEAALTRIRKVGDSALQRSEQGADAAQRAFEENPLRAGGREARDAAEQRLINDRALVGNAQADLDNRRRAIQQNPQVQAITGEMEAIKQRRQVLEAKEKAGALNPAENAELDAATKRYIELVRQLELATKNLTEADRKQRDIINSGIIAREKELDALRRKAEQDPAFDRRRDAAGQIAEDSRRQADEAQQRYINNPTEENKKRRDEADQRYRDDRMKAEGLQDSLDAKRKAMQQDPRVAAIDKNLTANNERLAELAEKEATGRLTQAEIKERARLQGENRWMRGDRDSIIDIGTRKEQGAIDDAQIAQNQRDRALRGRDLGMTDRERFQKEFREGAGADINARAKEMRDKGEDPTKFLRQAVSNQLESVAPMLKQFQDERQNALLQGPSRAALTVSDVSTSQGQSELNRLLRGDDSAKNVNLAELRKQTQKFDELIETIKKSNPGVLL
jgi:hypothetical protein